VTADYAPRDYWERRLRGSFNLQGVGHKHFSERYNRSLYRRKGHCLEAALAGETVAARTVLDIGCGTGYFVEWYLRHGASVRGIDITEVSVQRLRERFAGEFRTQDISAADYDPGTPVDIVNMWDVMYHIVDPAGFERALANVARSLGPGGLFLCSDWFGAPHDVRIADHVQGRCLATYDARLPSLGLERVALLPLFHLLNKRRLGGLDNVIAPLYRLLDDRATRVSPDNLSLGVWRRC
jgi:SAM-dependent methyltransferase